MYTQITIAAIIQFIIGAVWYSPVLFGKTWMHIMGGDKCTPEEMAKMQRSMRPFFVLQFVLTFFMTTCFANLLPYVSDVGVYRLAFWIWLGFMLPNSISAVIWANTPRRVWVKQILITIGMEFVGMMVAAWVLSR